MIRKILLFELCYRLKTPLAALILLMMAAQGIWFAMGVYDFNTCDEALINGSGVFYQCLAGGGMLVIIIVAMITTTTLYRDISCRSADYVYAFPVNEKRFFLGHFLSAYFINLIIVGAYPMGMALIKYIGVAEPHLLGPVPWLQLLHGYLIFSVPNLFILSAICYVCLVFTRRISATYLGVAAVTIFFLIGEAMSNNSPFISLLSVMDPFGYVYAKHMVALMPVEAKNSGFMPLTGLFFLNRFIWVGLGALGMLLCYRKFSFRYFIQNPHNNKDTIDLTEPDTPGADGEEGRVLIPLVSTSYGFSEDLKRLWRLSVTEFYSVTRPTSFRIIFGILVIIILLQNLLWNSTYYIGHQVPVTSGMTNVRLVNGFLFNIVLMVLSAELFFKERINGFWLISGSAPTPNWVIQLAKLLAMAGVSFLVAAAILLGGLFAQLIQGFLDIDWLLYMGDLFGYRFGWLTYLFNIILVFFLAGLLGNRYLTHVVAIGYYIFLLVSFDLGLFEELRFGYPLIPGVDNYSEMNGYGIWELASRWYFFMWASLAAVLVLVSIQVWQRGTEERFFHVKRFLGGELPLKAKTAVVVLLLLFLNLQAYIGHKVNGSRNFIPEEQADAEAAAYEERYRAGLEELMLQGVVYEVRADFHPQSRKAEYSASVLLKNKGPLPVDKLHINIDFFTRISSITADRQPLKLLERDPKLGMSVYRLPAPLDPKGQTMLFFDAVKQYTGFTQGGDDPQADLAFNGMFFTETVPFIGFDEAKSLLQNRDRETYRLKKLSSRLPAVDDPRGLARQFVSPLSCPEDDKLNITVSTTAPQQPFGPGRLVRKWEEDGRVYAHFQVDNASMVQPYLGSARHLQRVVKAGDVKVTYLHHPAHVYNLDEFTESIEAGIDFINTNLGPYPFSELRIAEIPFYQEPSYAMANTIVLSEKEGWFADGKVGEIRGYIQYVLARDLIRQWLAAGYPIARVRGADMLWSGLPSAMALQVVKKRLGSKRVDELMKKLLKRYRKERTNEPNIEQPLLYGDNIEYLERNKGVMALYRLSESMGFETFNQMVTEWLGRRDGALVFRDLYLSLKEKGVVDKRLWDLFEKAQRNVRL